MIPLGHVLVLGALMVAVGVFGVLLRRNVLFMLLSLEVALNGVMVAFIGAASHWGQPDGQVFALFVLTMSAAEVAVGLALVVQLFRRAGTLDADTLDAMRG